MRGKPIPLTLVTAGIRLILPVSCMRPRSHWHSWHSRHPVAQLQLLQQAVGQQPLKRLHASCNSAHKQASQAQSMFGWSPLTTPTAVAAPLCHCWFPPLHLQPQPLAMVALLHPPLRCCCRSYRHSSSSWTDRAHRLQRYKVWSPTFRSRLQQGTATQPRRPQLQLPQQQLQRHRQCAMQLARQAPPLQQPRLQPPPAAVLVAVPVPVAVAVAVLVWRFTAIAVWRHLKAVASALSTAALGRTFDPRCRG